MEGRLDTIAIGTFEDDAHGKPSRLTRGDGKVATSELDDRTFEMDFPLDEEPF